MLTIIDFSIWIITFPQRTRKHISSAHSHINLDEVEDADLLIDSSESDNAYIDSTDVIEGSESIDPGV